MVDDKRHLIPKVPSESISTLWQQQVAQELSRFDWGKFLPEIEPSIVMPRIDLSGLNEPIREYLTLMARGGWYSHDDMSLGLIRDVALEIKSGRYQEADNAMIAFYEMRHSDIKSFILERLPRRSQVLAMAFKAHELGEYILSVPVFLIQADGVCFDVARVQLYSRSKRANKPKIAEIIERADVDIPMRVLLSPLATGIPLTANSEERNDPNYPPGALNRHQVLHGETTDFGTKANSLKTISLLHYICDMSEALSKLETA